MTHFSCDIYRNYAPEDCAHMGEHKNPLPPRSLRWAYP